VAERRIARKVSLVEQLAGPLRRQHPQAGSAVMVLTRVGLLSPPTENIQGHLSHHY
jgi:hypothetical protein